MLSINKNYPKNLSAKSKFILKNELPGLPGSVIFSSKVDVQWHSTGDINSFACAFIHRLSFEFESNPWRLQTYCFWVALLVFCLNLCLPLQLSKCCSLFIWIFSFQLIFHILQRHQISNASILLSSVLIGPMLPKHT